MKFFVSGIGTGVGKTIASAILTEALEADYWKPVQAGELEQSDTKTVRALVSNPHSRFFPEAYALRTPVSPHWAAELDGLEIRTETIALPATDRDLIVEGAGGLLVPLNARDSIIDLIERLGLPVVLVSRHYLGSINHTLLSIEALQRRGLPIAGIIFNGAPHPSTESIILARSGAAVLGRIAEESAWNQAVVQKYAQQWRRDWAETRPFIKE